MYSSFSISYVFAMMFRLLMTVNKTVIEQFELL